MPAMSAPTIRPRSAISTCWRAPTTTCFGSRQSTRKPGESWVDFNRRLMRFSLLVIRAAPDRYAAWLVGATTRLFGRSVTTNLPAVLALLVVALAWPWRLLVHGQTGVTPDSRLDFPVHDPVRHPVARRIGGSDGADPCSRQPLHRHLVPARRPGVDLLGDASAQATRGPRVIDNKKICVVLPAYNAARTLERTFRDISPSVVDDVVLVDDASTDDTLRVAEQLGIFAVAHDRNTGLRRQPENLLPARARARRRHRHHAAPGLPIRSEAAAADRVPACHPAFSTSCSARAFSASARSPAACRVTNTSPTAC